MDGQTLAETPFPSIVHAFWYVVVTVTTVGYGDVVPTTKLGKVIGSVTILSGMVVLAMPVGVIGANFSTEYERVQQEKRRRQKMADQTEAMAQIEREQADLTAQESDQDLASSSEGLACMAKTK